MTLRGRAASPLVGVAGEGLVVRKPFGEQPLVVAPLAVVAGVRGVGARVVVLPPGPGPDDLADLDALVLTGGADLGVDPVRDHDELVLARAAHRTRLPVLGVCRGLQVLAVATGGTLVPELGEGHRIAPPGTHPVLVEPGSVVAGFAPGGAVGSLHHQSVLTWSSRWRCTATALDGVVEALEWVDQDEWPAVGVQWHPELDGTGPAVFGWIVRAATRRRRAGWTDRSAPGARRPTADSGRTGAAGTVGR